MKRIHGAGGGSGATSSGGGSGSGIKSPRPPIIAQDDAGLKTISFAKLQFLLCEGEIEGPYHGNTKEGLEKSVYLDDTPIRSNSDDVNPQPEDLVFSWGRPQGAQTGVPDYNRVSQVETIDTACRYQQPVTKAVTGAVTGAAYYARVLLTWEGLQTLDLGDGDVRDAGVNYKVEYTDGLGVNRIVFDDKIQGKFSSTFQRSHEFLLEGQGPTWTVKVTRLSRDDDYSIGTDRQYTTTFNFSTVTLSLDQKFSYANSSMLSVGIRADLYSAIPNVSIDLKGMKIEIPSNYDPVARTYTGTWDGTFKVAYSDNPAWVLRDLILNDRYGAGQYIDANSVDKWSLYSVAQYCDEQVPAYGGGTEPRFTCNLLLQSGEEAWNVLQQISSIFRGLLYYAASIAVVAQDRDKDAIFTFNESNTIEQVSDDGQVSTGNFTYSGTARRARHTVCLASWDDPENNFETRIEYVTDDETFEAYGYRPKDLRLLGVTSRGQAMRAANWFLLSERLLDDTVSFSTNEIGMSLRPGDIIKIADPTKAAVRAGGRITGVVGNHVTVDHAPIAPPGGYIGATMSWMYNDADNQPRLYTTSIQSIGSGAVLSDWENGEGYCYDPITVEDFDISDVDDGIITICTNPMDSRFDPGTLEWDDADVTPRGEIRKGLGDVVVVLDVGPNPPDPMFPFLMEFPARSAQDFRVLTVEQAEEGVYNISALRYRGDIYDAVDFDTPLEEDENYLFKAVAPGVPRGIKAQVVWDNNQAKIDVRWAPPENNEVLFEYDLMVNYYRLQWQSGTVQDDGSVVWANAWAETPFQRDDREMVPIEQLTISDRFRVRIAAVGRLGIQSDWSDPVVADDITVWFSLPDLGSVPGVLTFQNQSSGSQLFTWDLSSLRVPPYANGMRVEVKPNRPLTATEAIGIKPPDAEGWYLFGDFELEKYAVCIFHADTNWNVRVSLNTSVQGLRGNTYATTIVDRRDIVPPSPELFTVVTDTDTESTAPSRRFSWSLPTSEIDSNISGGARVAPTPNWPLGKVTDIVQFLVRYKAGLNNDWDLGVSLFADGVPGDQRYFETNLFDGGVWTVMIRAVDRTGWVSDDQASTVVNFGDAIPTNVVETHNAAPGWNGQLDNMQINGSGHLEQIDPTQDGTYFYPFQVVADQSGLLITTTSVGTYQWSIRRIGSDVDDPMYPNPQTDPMYPNPQSDYMYLDTSAVIGEDYHPYVPFEKLEAGNYEIACRIRSVDGVTPTVLEDVQVDLDYPDIRQTMEDVVVNATTQRIYFPKPFPNKCKAVNLTLQDPPGTVTIPATAYIRGKDPAWFEVRLLDPSGNVISGLVDVVAVGY